MNYNHLWYIALFLCIYNVSAHTRCNLINETNKELFVVIDQPKKILKQLRNIKPNEHTVWRHHTNKPYVLIFFDQRGKQLLKLTNRDIQAYIDTKTDNIVSS